MKRLLLTFALLVVAQTATAETLTKDQLTGTWVTQKAHGIRNNIVQLFFGAPEEKLEVTKSFAVTYTYGKDSEKQQVLRADASAITVHDDLITITFKNAIGVTFKLVLSGWSTPNGKLLFGQLYLYNKDGLFNGIPVSFEPIGS